MSEAGWFDDPTKRHERRYWDGEQWTEHVTDNAAPKIDPLAGPSPSGPNGPVPTQPSTENASGAPEGGVDGNPAVEPIPLIDSATTRAPRKRWPWIAAAAALLLIIAGGIAAAASGGDNSGVDSSSVTSPGDSPATFSTTTTTVPVPAVHHIGDVITYTNTSTDAPFATLQFFSFNPNTPCTLSYGCGDYNGGPIAAVDLQVCATGTGSVPYNTLGVKIVTSDNRQWGELAIGGPEPSIGSGELTAGTCKRGWASLKAPTAGSAPITGLVWDYGGFPATTIVP